MEETKTKIKRYGLAAAICMIIAAVDNLAGAIAYMSASGTFDSDTARSIILLLISIVTAVTLIIRKEKLTIIVLSASFLVSIIGMFKDFNIYYIPSVLYQLSVIFLLLVVFTELLPNFKGTAQKLFFVPLVLQATNIIVSLLVNFIKYDNSFATIIASTLFSMLLTLLVALFLSLLIKYPNGKKVEIKIASTSASTSGSQVPEANSSLFIPFAKHILLMLFTFGIYYFIWIYKTTEKLSIVKPEKTRSATKELLLCIFIPFYIIFWIYKTAQIVDEFAKDNNVQSDISTLCLILAIFVSIVPPILIQDKINSIVTNNNSQPIINEQPKTTQPMSSTADEIKKYKELLDIGAITQEEYDAKKRELL